MEINFIFGSLKNSSQYGEPHYSDFEIKGVHLLPNGSSLKIARFLEKLLVKAQKEKVLPKNLTESGDTDFSHDNIIFKGYFWSPSKEPEVDNLIKKLEWRLGLIESKIFEK